jgi:hypothetical protein
MAIIVADKAKWEKAIEKCKAEKPRVRKLEEFGKFEVCGKGGCYIVSWTGKGQEMKATCTCPAGAKNKPCYHVPATSGAFKLAVQERACARHCAVEGCYSTDIYPNSEECVFHATTMKPMPAFGTPEYNEQIAAIEAELFGQAV